MLVGEKVVDGKVITTDASGKVLSKDIAADGWSCHDGAYVRTVELNVGWNLVDGEYYYKAGNRLPVGRTEIDGSKYYFIDGKMQTNFATKDGLFDHYLDFYFGSDGIWIS